MSTPLTWFTSARYGLFIHYGLYSILSRGEWVWNREEIPRDEYMALTSRFTATHFDADALCQMAVESGMRYVVLTTMHHDGFRLYPTELSDFHIGNSGASGRDLVAETIAAARAHGLKVGLYHSLNNWYDQPDSVAALEDSAMQAKFVAAAHERMRELVTRYNPIDILWYDGWWPYHADGWQAEKMNAMVKAIQPQILLNGRNGLAGDFATPEQHLTAPDPWRPWEGCITLNNSWGYHSGDQDWKPAPRVIEMLARCAQGNGNLLLNVGPDPDGRVPEECARILLSVGEWLRRNGEAIYGTEVFSFHYEKRGDYRGDWNYYGPMTAKGKNLYWFIRRPGCNMATLGGLLTNVRAAYHVETGAKIPFQQSGTRVQFHDVPAFDSDGLWPVIRIECDSPPMVYQSGGIKVPSVPHPHYDPCPPDIAY